MPLSRELTKWTTASPNIITYDYSDIATGEGFVTYYTATTKETTNTGYILIGDSSTYSNDEAIATTLPMSTTPATKLADLDFDLSDLKITQTFQGNGNITVTWSISGSVNGSAYLIFKLRKWDGTTETEVANVQSETINASAGTVTETSLIPLSITNHTYAVGTNIRLTVEVWGVNSSAIANGTISFKTDPTNRNGTSTNPNFLKVNLPQKIE